MTDFYLNIPSKVLFGIDTINRLGSFIKQQGSRVLIVTEAILYENDTILRIQDFLDKKSINYITFDEVVPNTTSTCLENGIKMCRISKINTVVGLGGIKALSIAKCIAMGANSRLQVDDILNGQAPGCTPLPYIEVPTTCRNPFMLKDEYLITDARTRRAYIGQTQQDITKYIIIDPHLSESIPRKYMASILLDTLLHALEGYISKKSSFLSDSFFVQAIELIKDTLPGTAAEQDKVKALIEASTAGFLVSLGLSMSQAGMGSALSYALNARHLIPKSWVSTILLPHIIEFNLGSATQKLKHLARILGEDVDEESDEDAAKSAFMAVQRLIAPFKLPSRLNEFDIKIDDLIDVAENAYSFDMINYMPKGVSVDDLYNLLKTAY